MSEVKNQRRGECSLFKQHSWNSKEQRGIRIAALRGFFRSQFSDRSEGVQKGHWLFPELKFLEELLETQ